MNPLERLRRPGRTWPAEHSLALRASGAGAVCVAIAACAAEGELPVWYAVVASVLVCTGGVFSYRRRTRPLPYLKVLLGAAMFGAFVWFFFTVSADAATGQLRAVETPLAALFSAMQAAHAFDMPTRRDLGFSIGGSATLIAVAGAQAIDLSFGIYVALWAAVALAGLHAAWSSMAGGRAPRPAAVLGATSAVLLVAALLVAFLPPPRLPSLSLGGGPGGTGGSGGTGGQSPRVVPSSASTDGAQASAGGPTRVGGFLGFAGPLDTALRPGLGNEVVLRVRADRPSYWVAQTYDSWSGRSWTQTVRPPAQSGPASLAAGDRPAGHAHRGTVIEGGSPFVVAPTDTAPSRPGTGEEPSPPVRRVPAQPDYQTFYLAASASNLVLHADQATVVWIPTPRLYVGPGGAIRTGEALGAGSVYSVLSTVSTPSDSMLAKVNGIAGLTATAVREDLQLPYAYPRVAALARRVTAHAPTVVAKVLALEHWIGAHTRYTLHIPPLAPGEDSVVQFLFGSRRGFCEQISTSLAVMLRTLGIPAREAAGYVPGRFDPITGLYDEQAKDAHAWVQVWFPGYGWQSFDPTSYVPAANPSPASTLASALVAAVKRVPVVPLAALLGLLVVALLARSWRRRRPRTWSARVSHELERAARRAGVGTGPGATLGQLAAALDDALDGARDDARGGGRSPGDRTAGAPLGTGTHRGPQGAGHRRRRVRARTYPTAARELASRAAEAAWGGADVPSGTGRHLVHDARRLRRAARHSPRAGAGATKRPVSSSRRAAPGRR